MGTVIVRDEVHSSVHPLQSPFRRRLVTYLLDSINLAGRNASAQNIRHGDNLSVKFPGPAAHFAYFREPFLRELLGAGFAAFLSKF